MTKPQHVDLLKRIKFTGWTVSTLLAAKDEKGALDTVVDALDLGPIMERSVEQLSGGELQVCFMHAYIHAYMHACIHTYIHTHTHACIHACIHTRIHTYMHTNKLMLFVTGDRFF